MNLKTKSKIKSLGFVIIALPLLSSCQSRLRFQVNPTVTRVASVFGSKSGIHPLLVSSCNSCHTSGAEASFFPFAQQSPQMSFQSFLSNPEGVKRLVRKVRDEGHPNDKNKVEGAISQNFEGFVKQLELFQESLCLASPEYCPVAELVTDFREASSSTDVSFDLSEIGLPGGEARLQLNDNSGFFIISNFSVFASNPLVLEGVSAELTQANENFIISLVDPGVTEQTQANSTEDLLDGVGLATSLDSSQSVRIRLKFKKIQSMSQ